MKTPGKKGFTVNISDGIPLEPMKTPEGSKIIHNGKRRVPRVYRGTLDAVDDKEEKRNVMILRKGKRTKSGKRKDKKKNML